MPRAPPSTAHGGTRVPKLSNFDLKFRCTVLTGDVAQPSVAQRRAFSEHGPFIRAVWRWLDIPLELCREKRRINFKNARQQHNTLETTLCFPLELLRQSSSDSECYKKLTELILGKGKYGMNGQCLTTKARGRWFTPATFEAIKDDLVRRMIAVARESYDAAVLAEKATAEKASVERASAERASTEEDSEAGTPSTGPDASIAQEQS